MRDEAAAAVLCVFAPRNRGEFARVLAPGGVRIDPDTSDRLAAQFQGRRVLSTLGPDPFPSAASGHRGRHRRGGRMTDRRAQS